MDVKDLKQTNSILKEVEGKFGTGDLVAYTHKQPAADYKQFPILGMVVANDPMDEEFALFPQISVFVFETQEVRLFWPAYLKVISAAKSEKT